MAENITYGTSGNDNLSGGNGKDTVYGLDGDDILTGGNGVDTLFGDGGNDQLYGGNGSDYLTGGAGDDLLDGRNGFDIAYYSGAIGEYSFYAAAGYLHILHLGGAGPDGHDRVMQVERLVFADRTINIGSGANAPVAGDDHVSINEDTGTYSSGSASVKDNDFDFDGDPLTVTGGTFTGTYGTLTLNSDGTYSYTLFASAQELGQGDNVQDSFSYTVSDNDGSDTGMLVFHIAGVNDAPVANPDTDTTAENVAILIDVLANDTDVDNGAVLTVTAASAPAGQGSVAVVGNQVEFDPGTDFDDLAVGESEEVVVSYDIEDEHGASSSSTITITVTGTNDGPVANPDTDTTSENATLLIDVLANDTDVDNGAVLTVTAASAPPGQGSVAVVGNQVEFDPGTDFDDLAVGESEEVVVSYDIEDEHGASSSSTITITVTGTNDGPVANPDTDTTSENATILIDVLANDTDADNGAVLTVTAASAPPGQGSASIVSNQVEFDPGTDFDDLAVGESEEVLVSYDIEDEHGASSSSTITIIVTGTNAAPVANPDTGSTDENSAVVIDVLANDTDADNSAALTVTAASAPVGQGSASVVGNQVEFDPGTDFDDLAVGESEEVVVGYDIEDEHGASSSSTITIIVTGTNDGPVANPDTDTTGENATILIDVLGNDTDADNGANLTITAVSGPSGQGTASIDGNLLRFDPGSDFDYLAAGESAVVVVSYDIVDEHGATASSTVTITIEGRDEGAVITATEGDDVLVGTGGDDTIDALGGNDSVSGLDGDDLILGGNGFDSLNGDGDNDHIEGGNDDDILFGGDGNDELLGQAGNDSLFGDNGNDELTGGDGGDSLSGGDGDDNLDGGNDDDSLSGGTGTNVLTGGAGNDTIDADSTDGAQAIDGGEGDDSIVHHYRHNASTITTGAGIDTIALTYADQGTAAIVVTDFTTGAGGDKFQLSGTNGELLNLLSGWDGSSNPFGSSGFLRLQQSGDDTFLQWDQNGTAGGSNWTTLVVFQNRDAGNFTAANFVPGYNPDGSAPAGETITGTEDGETLIGTIGNDTINALGGDDSVSGLAGADVISGGDGFDFLNGDADDDVIDGGNDDDVLFGGDGHDQLLGQAGNDSLFGDSGNDQLTGGDGNDGLSGGDGDDNLDGGNDDDSLSGGAGTNVLTGGGGNDAIDADSTDGAQTIDGGEGDDSIVHYYRHNASTITTGAGIDTIALAYADQGTAAIIVTDFTPGAGGDKVQLSGYDGALLSLLEGWDGSSNPFGSSGFLRLQQSGADTLLQWDKDGEAGTGADWETLVVFQGKDADDFTEANFVPGYDPDGGVPAGQTITGTEDGETLIGTIGNDTINALGGNDSVSGLAGADVINGGDGFDFLSGNGDDDVIDGGNDDDYLFGDDGHDQLFGQAGNDSLFGDNGNDQLSGGDGSDNLSGGDGDNSLDGGNDDDFLVGGSDADVLTGGAGYDVLYGGDGADIFAFQSASDGPDEISDFVSDSDTIQVSASGFGGGLTAGGTVSLVSGSDPTASAATGQFLFDTDDGRLLWDADGTGTGEAVLIATFSNIPPLAASDFAVV